MKLSEFRHQQAIVDEWDLPAGWLIPDSYICLEPVSPSLKWKYMDQWRETLRTTTAAQRDREGIKPKPFYDPRDLDVNLQSLSRSVHGYPDNDITMNILKQGVHQILRPLKDQGSILIWVDREGRPGVIDDIEPYVSGGLLRFGPILNRSEWMEELGYT